MAIILEFVPILIAVVKILVVELIKSKIIITQQTLLNICLSIHPYF